jgi:hypothetical protein
MAKKKKTTNPSEVPSPAKNPEITTPSDPEEPIVAPEEDPDYIPDDDPFETPPYEIPPPAEGP